MISGERRWLECALLGLVAALALGGKRWEFPAWDDPARLLGLHERADRRPYVSKETYGLRTRSANSRAVREPLSRVASSLPRRKIRTVERATKVDEQ